MTSHIGYATVDYEPLRVEFSARPVTADYGVPGSPVWTEWEDVEVVGLYLYDFPVEMSALSPELQDFINCLADEAEFVEEAPEQPILGDG